MAVATETKPGTMTDDEGQKSPESKVKTPEATVEVSPEEEQPKIYNQKQADALVHAARSEAGRKLKEVEVERDNLKSQIMTKENQLEDIQAERESLETQLEDLSSGDPRKFDLIKKGKELRNKEHELKGKLTEYENREKTFAEREKKVNTFELQVLIESIADDYEDGDATKLKGAIGGFEKPTEEQIRSIADIFWKKKTQGEDKKPKSPKPYSGKSEGGSPYIKQSEINALWAAGRGEEVQKAQKEGRIRLGE